MILVIASGIEATYCRKRADTASITIALCVLREPDLPLSVSLKILQYQ